ncbi:hypothetical protein EDWATA_01334 [Edwardsiella tarda ATCC 23685]|uniref:Uncharacterized protein n=1 Tax=Edwardsiella tarda ATCC 23685 TaxID=500638 RepID=D4F3M4_EDWTA|nr:hypothetical protein EDWATA_01334 [Edwardsiella tarda ATCC 23685]GAC62995.1 hypothetical protein ET1_01_00540 [Edwardsiella tarda ATCC 15947 = NBRC 105688]
MTGRPTGKSGQQRRTVLTTLGGVTMNYDVRKSAPSFLLERERATGRVSMQIVIALLRISG